MCDIFINAFKLGLVFFLFNSFLDEFELFDHLFNQIHLFGFGVLFHDEFDDCSDEGINKEPSCWAHDHVKYETEDRQE